MPKSVLVITYYWPPSGGPAVQRWLSFANELTKLGHPVHVLTVDPRCATYQLHDESLVSDIDPNITVHTTKTLEPFGIYKKLFGKRSIPAPAFANETDPSIAKKIARAIRGNFFVPDPRRGWKRYAVPAAENIISAYKINTVITAGPPHSTHFIGEALKRKKAVRWIADFHDLWTDVIYYKMLYHLPPVKNLDQALERRILEGADLIFTVGNKYKQKLLSKSGKLSSEKIEIVPIGYDAHLFRDVAVSNNTHFTITYAGGIADFYQPQVFFDAIAALPETYLKKIKLQFVGVLSAGIKQYILQKGLENLLEEKGYLPHKAAVQEIKNANALLLVNPVTADESMVIPGKLYEYLAAGKPIINITVPEAETATIIKECSAGQTFSRGDVAALQKYLTGLVADWLEGRSNAATTSTPGVEQFSREFNAARISRFIS